MRCPNCFSGVAEGMRFCGNCGTPLGVLCPACGTASSPGQRFCGACGTALGPASAPLRERRLVSVLFCDLVGFTSFSESRDHEDVRDVLEQYFAAARGIITTYGGTIEKFIGDAVMAVWGAPLAQEDDAERAVRAALGLVEAVASLRHRLGVPELRVRLGVLTGEAAVTVGTTDSGMVIGDSVNTAARIQSVADPGTVLVDDTTRLACERAVAFEPAGAHQLKGKSQPVRLWRAKSMLAGSAETARSGAVEPPFVGRHETLRAIAAAVDQVLAPHPSVSIVSVVGDAGIGKTRLSWELERRLRGAGASWYRGRSVAFGEGIGLSALVDVARDSVGISRDAPPDAQRRDVLQFLSDRFPDGDERARVARALCRLLGLDDDGAIEQGELFSAWRELFERRAAEEPIVLVFEELQLADQALLDFIAHLWEWADDAAMLILVLSRPDARLESLPASVGPIELGPLSDTEMEELVVGAVQRAPEALVSAIRADGGGVPLYAVETLRELADRGVLGPAGSHYVVLGALGEVSVPPTIRALVSSRLDRVGPLERRVLTAGAVLGERFSAVGAAALADLIEADTRVLLDGLVSKALLDNEPDVRSSPQARYAFVQGVVRRVALDRISRRERRRLHLAAVDHLSQESASAPDLAAVLAAHLLAAADADPKAGDIETIKERARMMLRAAAERSAAVGAVTEALSMFDKAVELEVDERAQATLLERAATVAYRSGSSDAAAERYRGAEEIHAAAGRTRERLRVRAQHLRALSLFRPPADLLPALRELDAELGDHQDSVKALAGGVLAFALYQCGEGAEALAVASRALETAETCGDQAEVVHALGAQGSALAQLERPHEAIAVYTRALALAERHDPRSLPPLLYNLAASLAQVGQYRRSAERAQDAIAAAQRGAARMFERGARLALGCALCSLGDWDQAVIEIETVKHDLPPFFLGTAASPLVVIALERGQDDRALALVADYDRRRVGAASSVLDTDFRVLRSAVLLMHDSCSASELARLLENAESADYGEWTGWLTPIVDRLVATGDRQPIEVASAALRGPGEMKQTAPVRAQAERLDAHLAAHLGDETRALEYWATARRLARDCGLVFEAAVVALERAEYVARMAAPQDVEGLADARTTFERLGAAPWLARAEQLLGNEVTYLDDRDSV